MKEGKTTKEHKRHAPKSVNIGIVTVSSTRTIEDDDSGRVIKEMALDSGHKVVAHMVVKDDRNTIQKALIHLIKRDKVEAVIINGGTGVSNNDITIEAVRSFFEKELTSFNPLFSYLSFKEIGSAAMLSRSTAGVYKNCPIFCIPGSPKACKLVMKALIIPELGHILHHLSSQ